MSGFDTSAPALPAMGRVRPELEQIQHDHRSLMVEEARVNQLAWTLGLITAGLAVAAMFAILIMLTRQSHNYALAVALVLTPVLFGIPSMVLVRTRQMSLYRKYHSRMLLATMQLQEVAVTDELTGLYNRRHFYNSLHDFVQQASQDKRQASIILLDLDGLKIVNDNHGHMIGDAVIARFAEIIQELTRETDIAARLGGDEFAVIMPDTDKRGAFALARRLWLELEEKPLYEKDDISLKMNVSVGVSGYPWGGETPDELLQWADTDLYANKVSRKVR
ncbi:MAG TPA: GGDEF domain-containing protein, partial [Dehalococcoidia bacterium]|nr:GGDEF domain-containing protein [Dehalococcoidia bacterium]